jgi:chromosomal replication initiator protein
MLFTLISGNGYRIRHSLPKGLTFDEKMNDLLNLASNHTKILKHDILSKSRKRELAYVRSCIMYVARKRNYGTLTKIGLYFEGRDHSTVINAVNLVQSFIDIKDKEILSILKALKYIVR